MRQLVVKLLNSAAILALLVFCWLMLSLSIPYFTFRHDVDFLLMKQKIIHIRSWRYAFYTHVFLSILTLVAGLTQFSKTLLKTRKKIHRVMGYIYVTDVLLLAGPSGLIMSFYANGNVWSRTSFVILSVLWMTSTFIALNRAVKKDLAAHKKWMIRSYALTLSAISLRLFAMLLPGFVHLDPVDEYCLISWASWTFNLLIAELIIFSSRNKPLLA